MAVVSIPVAGTVVVGRVGKTILCEESGMVMEGAGGIVELKARWWWSVTTLLTEDDGEIWLSHVSRIALVDVNRQ